MEEVVQAGGESRRSFQTMNDPRGSLASPALRRSKARREKIRRDRLNDRFIDLYSVLAPGNFRRSNKVAILSCAARLLKQLKSEIKKLKDKNHSLQEGIRIIKEEKMVLREEKFKLKAQKERMEQMIKGISTSPFSAPLFACIATNSMLQAFCVIKS